MRLFNYYFYTVAPEFIWKQDLNSVNQLPFFNKMVLSSTSKLAIRDKKWYFPEISALELISGQKGKKLVQRRSIQNFQIREGQLLGCKFTLRKQIMYSFLDRFVTTILPQLSEVKSISTFNKKDDTNIGLNTLFFFTELEQNYQFFEQVSGFNLALVNVVSSSLCRRTGGETRDKNNPIIKQLSSLSDRLHLESFSQNKKTFPIFLRKRKNLLLFSSFQWPNR